MDALYFPIRWLAKILSPWDPMKNATYRIKTLPVELGYDGTKIVKSILIASDRLGFELKFTHYNKKEYTEFIHDYNVLKRSRAAHWAKYTKGDKLPEKSERVKQSVRLGIPDSLRPQAWFRYSGAANLCLSNPGLYTHLTFQEQKDHSKRYTSMNNPILEFVAIVDKGLGELIPDLFRTFPNNHRFQVKRNTDSLVPSIDSLDVELSQDMFEHSPELYHSNPYLTSLRNILVAFAYYSWPHPDKQRKFPRKCTYNIGYCQSMNLIVGMLLLVFVSQDPITQEQFEKRNEKLTLELEESIFWILVATIEILMPPEVYGVKLLGSQIQQEILWEKLFHDHGKDFGLDELSKWMEKFDNTDTQLVRRKTQHLGEIEMHVRKTFKGPSFSMVTTPWFLTLFVEMVPSEDELTACSEMSDSWRLLRDFPKSAYNCENFINICFNQTKIQKQSPLSLSRIFGLTSSQEKLHLNQKLNLETLDPFEEAEFQGSIASVNNKMIQRYRGIVIHEHHERSIYPSNRELTVPERL
ncbi:Growth hormone-regulated TBC protein 1 [Boothiomyces macroporosus]|uniref:Growth hormone-regulated TBC protein 1 n=1 Tax=Boothiomyces macroporosus TaxID=261099 RepID=A0AAD5Y5F1_9FUNG|nr:Growth hormone-regulated TBC protein 1 [Boothiomyces macroporosus]